MAAVMMAMSDAECRADDGVDGDDGHLELHVSYNADDGDDDENIADIVPSRMLQMVMGGIVR